MLGFLPMWHYMSEYLTTFRILSYLHPILLQVRKSSTLNPTWFNFYVHYLAINTTYPISLKHAKVEQKWRWVLNLIEKFQHVLFGKSKTMLTWEIKDREWTKLAGSLSAVSKIQRVKAIKEHYHYPMVGNTIVSYW